MKILFLAIYNLALPIFLLVAALPFYSKMRRRGGWTPELTEKFGIFSEGAARPCDVLVSAVSVGEVRVALKLCAELLRQRASLRIVLAVGTITGRQVALSSQQVGIANVIYAPLDTPGSVHRFWGHFRPKVIVFIEGEVWPNLVQRAAHASCPMLLVNARLSPRSAQRFLKFLPISRQMFSELSWVGTPNQEDFEIWKRLHGCPHAIHLTGSIKFDPVGDDAMPQRRPEFQEILDRIFLGVSRPLLVAVSTHPDEELAILSQLADLAVDVMIAPRHAERVPGIIAQFKQSGIEVVTLSEIRNRNCVQGGSIEVKAGGGKQPVLLLDSTGELRDWTAHADLALIGKSWLAEGGQNPVEAIQAGIPVVAGPNMQNFASLVDELRRDGGIEICQLDQLRNTIQSLLDNPQKVSAQVNASRAIIQKHSNANRKSAAAILNYLVLPHPNCAEEPKE